MTYRGAPHFLDCTCQCESKRLLLQACLQGFNELSVSKRSFLLLDTSGQTAKPSDHYVQYDEYQCIGLPTSSRVMERLHGNIGDLFIDITPRCHALYAKVSPKEWKQWPGPLSVTNPLRHPLYPKYVLWCHPSTKIIGWFFDFLVNKSYCDGSAHDIIYAILQERREAEFKQPPQKRKNHPSPGQGPVAVQAQQKPPKRKNYPSGDQEGVAVRKKKKLKQTAKASHNTDNPQAATTTLPTPPTISANPIHDPLPVETIVRLNQEALDDLRTALQKLTTHPIPSLASDSLRSLSNLHLLDNPSPHSSAIPVAEVTTSKPGHSSSSPMPLESEVPIDPSPQCISDEGVRNLRNDGVNAAIDNSVSADKVLTALDPEKEANANELSSVDTLNLVNHDTSNELVMADVTHHADTPAADDHNSLVEQESHIDLPSNPLGLVTTDKFDDGHTGNIVESATRTCLSPVPIPAESLELEASPNDLSVDNVGEILSEEASHLMTKAFNLHSDETLTVAATALEFHPICNQPFPDPQPPDPPLTIPDPAVVTGAFTNNLDSNSHITCNQPFPRPPDPLTTPDPAVIKGVISESTPSVEQTFRLNCSLKEIIFHVSENSRLICRLCLGTRTELSDVLSFSMDDRLDALSDHCMKEHLQLCEVLRRLSAEEIDSFKQHFSH